MFVENYRVDTMIGGQAQTTIPYPRISEADWQKWKAFLPVRSVPFCKKVLLRKTQSFMRAAYGIPHHACDEMIRAAGHFEEIEIWSKREISKDPIAVGITENGERYLICRWGMDKLVPFERIESRSWIYQIQNFGVNVITSENFWFGAAVATVFGIGYIALWLNA